jgi:kynureninase
MTSISMTAKGSNVSKDLEVKLVNNSLSTLVDALREAKRVSNDELTQCVAAFDAAGGVAAGDNEDIEQDPEDVEVDPLDEGLELIAKTTLSPPAKKAKEHEGGPVAKLSALSAELHLDVRGRDFALALDERDTLAAFRAEFCIPMRPDGITTGLYFVGNSLGLMPKTARARVQEELDAWEACGVEGHFTGARPWAHADDNVRVQVAGIVGAQTAEVVAMNGLTVNLHLMITAFYRPTATRHCILMEKKSFPSDRYAVESQVRLHVRDPAVSIIEVGPREGEWTIRTEDIEAAIARCGDALALCMFSGVQYYTGQLFQIERITAAAHAVGAIAGWDLAHAVGNALLHLHDWGVDWAVWCSYKYLNSGPGGMGGAFVHQRFHGDRSLIRLSGWWGHNWSTRFEMNQPWDPIPDAYGFRLSNPPILQLATHLAAVDIFQRATMTALRAKSELLTAYLVLLLQSTLDPGVVEIITPMDPSQRGCQLSLFWHVDVDEAFELLAKRGVYVDVRRPSVTRVAPVPLYNSFMDVWELVTIIGQVVDAVVAKHK